MVVPTVAADHLRAPEETSGALLLVSDFRGFSRKPALYVAA